MYYFIHWQKTLIVFLASAIAMNGIIVLLNFEFNPDVFISLTFILFLGSFGLVQVYERFKEMKSEIESLKEEIELAKKASEFEQEKKKIKRTPMSELFGDRHKNTTAEHVGKTTLLFMNNGKEKEEEPEDDSAYAIARNLRRRGRG